MPTGVRSINREDSEAFLVAELELSRHWPPRPVRCRSPQQIFRWGPPVIRMRPPKLTEEPAPALPYDHIWLLLADCSGEASRNRQVGAIIALLLDTGTPRRHARHPV
jgi:hypothetical protein